MRLQNQCMRKPFSECLFFYVFGPLITSFHSVIGKRPVQPDISPVRINYEKTILNKKKLAELFSSDALIDEQNRIKLFIHSDSAGKLSFPVVQRQDPALSSLIKTFQANANSLLDCCSFWGWGFVFMDSTCHLPNML